MLHDFKHSRTHSVAVIDSLIRCALKVSAICENLSILRLSTREPNTSSEAFVEYLDQVLFCLNKILLAVESAANFLFAND